MTVRPTFGEQTTKFPAHSALLKRKQKTFGIRPIKGKKTSTCLEIHFCDFRCSAVEVPCLKWHRMNLIGLCKTFSIKVMTFTPVLETFGCYCG